MIIILLVLLMGIISAYYIYYPNRSQSLRFLYWLCIVLWCLLPAIRNEYVGTDTRNYIDFFLHPQLGYNGRDKSEIEIGFVAWNYIIAGIFNNQYFYLFMSGILSTSLKIYYLNKLTDKSIQALFLLSTLVLLEPFLFVEYGIMRQCISISFFLGMFYCMYAKKHFLYSVLLGMLAISFHASTLLPIIIVICIYYCKINPSKKSLYIMLILSMMIGNVFLTFVQSNISLFSFLGIAQIGYIERLDSTSLINGYGYYRNIIPLSLYGFFMIYYHDKNKCNDFIFQTAFWGIVLNNIFITIPIGQRILFCMIPIVVISIVRNVNRNNVKYIIPVVLFEFYRLYSYYISQNSGAQELGDGNVVFPYKTFIL